jgi:hypothetical protein
MFAQSSPQVKVQDAQQLLKDLQFRIEQAARDGTALDTVERDVVACLLSMGKLMLGEFLRQVGPGDLGPVFALEDGRTLQRWPEPVVRRLLTVFGELQFPRFVYGTRPGQKIELVPTDQRLSLPESELSYLLQEWNQLLAVEQAFGQVDQSLKTILGLEQSVDTLERGNRQMAQAAPAFRAAQPAPDPGAEGQLIVATVDNKGVPMVRPAAATVAGAHRTKGQKANQKQMACIGAVYTVDLHIRPPEELLETLFRTPPSLPKQGPRQAPKARQKRYWAALSRAVNGVAVCAQDEVFGCLAQDLELRRRERQMLVILSDGQPSLEEDAKKYLPRDRWTVVILDLMHVIPRLWEAAHLFHAEGSEPAEQFVRKRLLRVLQGKAGKVVAALRRMGARRGLRGAKRARLRRICNYLQRNLHRMEYAKYLEAGYPIATGVIEGACRHVIKDRMERAGMRWKVPGAQAMLQLRTIHAQGDWRTFGDFRMDHETRRLYPHQQALGKVAWPLAA